MYPGHWASVKPHTDALVNTATNERLSWTALNDRSNQIAQLLHARGLRSGDHVALLMENHLDYFTIAWATFRSGLYLTCINRYLTAEEAAYIINDSGSQALFTSDALSSAEPLLNLIPDCTHRFCKGTLAGYEAFDTVVELSLIHI